MFAATERHLDPVRGIPRAIEALRRQQVVILPTETRYGLAASLTSASALDRLSALTGAPTRAAWHAPDWPALRAVIQPEHPAHIRLLRRLTPGPVTFLFDLAPERRDQVIRDLGAAGGWPGGLGAALSPNAGDQGNAGMAKGTATGASGANGGAAADGGGPDRRAGAGTGGRGAGVIAARVPDYELTREILRGCWEQTPRVPVVADAVSAAGWGTWPDATRPGMPPESARIAIILDTGPTRLRAGSTVVRLGPGGVYAVVTEGAVQARHVRRALERSILFVCTGNTCRSPMAAAIARHELSTRMDWQPATVRSAGVSVGDGEPMARPAAAALKKLGVPVEPHTARELSRQWLADADEIYALTAGHLRAIRQIDPSVAERARLLDPAGADIPDPVGGSQELYDQTARRLRELVNIRLDEG